MLQTRFENPPVPSIPQLCYSHRLRDRPFNACPRFILFLVLFCLLTRPRPLHCFLIGFGACSRTHSGATWVKLLSAHRIASQTHSSRL